ncbi:hypothetical protein [Marilutibacter spongiae]|uniref:Secreted protein n=1 Tax=Marilutibacter spongiae TaxID=2025720 RepID=A0A7W3TIK0_9GAMM|nr:hypothetical protein [Lysobacter spongiae]MBB1058957.1 hypothetical protein [Lysobacter spongiae]
MFRICLCLVIALVAAPVVAREVKLSSPNGGGCSDSAPSVTESKQATAQPRASRSKPAPNETRAKPSVHGDAAPSGRLQSPRWHSFLPGMVR